MRQHCRDPELWTFSLEATPEQLVQAECLLSRAELSRANRFRFRKHRRRFIVRRAMRRIVLGHLVDREPAALEFREGPYGRPGLKLPAGRLEFNTSHSEECAVVVTGHHRLGVDIEHVHRDMDHRRFAEHSFSEQESADILAHSSERLARAFFCCWTGKEAYLKGLGEGLQKGLKTFAVNAVVGDQPGLLWDLESTVGTPSWQFWRLCREPYLVTIVAPVAEQAPLANAGLSLESLCRGQPVVEHGQSPWLAC